MKLIFKHQTLKWVNLSIETVHKDKELNQGYCMNWREIRKVLLFHKIMSSVLILFFLHHKRYVENITS